MKISLSKPSKVVLQPLTLKSPLPEPILTPTGLVLRLEKAMTTRAAKPIITSVIGGGGQPTRLVSHFGDRSETRAVPGLSVPDRDPFEHTMVHSSQYSVGDDIDGDSLAIHTAALAVHHPNLRDQKFMARNGRSEGITLGQHASSTAAGMMAVNSMLAG